MAAANNDTRVDTTFIGFFLIGFILLLFGVYRLQSGDIFGEDYSDLPIDKVVYGQLSGVIGLLMIILTVFAYRTGKKMSAGIFAFFGLFFIFVCYNRIAKSSIINVSNSDWFLPMAFAIFFLIFAIYALVDKAPKFVALLLLLTALMVFFLSISFFYGSYGLDNVDIHNALSIVSAIFAFLGFIVAVYLGLAYANPKKIPLI